MAAMRAIKRFPLVCLLSLSAASCAAGAALAQNCSVVPWTAGVDYSLGTVVRYGQNGGLYKVVNVVADGTDATDPTISTWYWAPASCTPVTGRTVLPDKVIAGYYPNWKPSPPRIRDLNPNYNLVYLFAAVPVGGAPGTTGAVSWTAPGDGRGAAANFVSDIQYARAVQGRRILLSVGGAGNGMSFPTRAKSQAFLDSIEALIGQFGGLDGLDWNTFEGSQAPDTTEMIWISLQLKQRYPGFLITAPPAPWNQVDRDFCKAMFEAGALDYAAPQYYDGPNLADPSYVATNLPTWVSLLGADHVVLGLGLNTLPNYMSESQAAATWNAAAAAYPAVRGAFDWEVGTDETQGWPFASGVAPLIR